jgi:ornithine carbamoyltransferase
MRGRDFISLMDCSAAELEQLLELAVVLKAGDTCPPYLAGLNVGLLFAARSTRTRVSFQVAVSKLGGHAEQYNDQDMHMSTYETLKDTAAVLGRYLDAIVVRLYDMSAYGRGRASLNTLAEFSRAPIINALDDKDHPCQVMADLLTLKERFGEGYKRKRLVMTWAYSERQQSPGVLHSMLTAAALLGMHVTFAHPAGFELDPEYLAFAERAARESGARINFSQSLDEAAYGADVIYAKSWKSLTMPSAEEQQFKERIRHAWCVSSAHFQRANPAALYMDCMPFIRGQQVTAEVVDGERSIIYDQAENRLHAQKAILASLLV